MPNNPWTWRQFDAAMKREGWVRLTGDPAGCKSYQYRHTPRVYVATDVVIVDGRHIEDWKQWARIRNTPPPF